MTIKINKVNKHPPKIFLFFEYMLQIRYIPMRTPMTFIEGHLKLTLEMSLQGTWAINLKAFPEIACRLGIITLNNPGKQ